jgi:hypothetical protein
MEPLFKTSYGAPTVSDLQTQLEALFHELPIAPPHGQGIPYAMLIPGIGRQLALMKGVDPKPQRRHDTRCKLMTMKRHARVLCEDIPAMAHLPLELRLSVLQMARAEIPDLVPMTRKGAPPKVLAEKVACTVAEHFYALTGNRPTRITPAEGGKAYSPFLRLLATTYRLLGIKASAENQAKSAIKFINEKYPER